MSTVLVAKSGRYSKPGDCERVVGLGGALFVTLDLDLVETDLFGEVFLE